MTADPPPLRIAVGLCLIASGLIGLQGLPVFGWIVYFWSNNSAPLQSVITFLILAVFHSAQILVGSAALLARDAIWRISVSWAAGVLLALGAILLLQNLYVMFVVIPMPLRVDVVRSLLRLPGILQLARQAFELIGAGLLVWMLLDRLKPPTVSRAAGGRKVGM